MVGSLRSHQPFAIDDKFIALRFAAENGMVFKNQTLQVGASFLLQRECCREPTNPSAHDDAIKHFPRVDRIPRG